MNRIIKSAAMLTLALFLTACGGEDEASSDNSVSQNYHNVKAALQGTVFDAITGARISDKSLKVYLVQGAKYRRAKVRTGDATFAGDYALSGIPTTTNSNITYRVATEVEGYQGFDSAVSFQLNTSNLQDGRANFLANIYLYPLGQSASDVKVNVTFNNEPVENATVLLSPRTGSNLLTAQTSNTALFSAQNGFQEAVSVVTDASGVATFPAASLTLGGNYKVSVLPATHEGIQLAANRSNTYFVVGALDTIRVVSLAQAVPGSDNGLYVTGASNDDSDALVSTGVLTVNFSRAITLENEQSIGADLVNATTAALDISDAPNSNVTAAVSSDGLTLTLTPVFATAPIAFNGTDNNVTADNGLEVRFENVSIRLVDNNDAGHSYELFGDNGVTGDLIDATGVEPSSVVKVTVAF